MIRDAQIGTKPAPGVMATRPMTPPVQAPITVGFPVLIVSISIQESMPAAAEVFVVIRAWTARPSAASARPAINPTQPNQRRNAPSTTKGT